MKNRPFLNIPPTILVQQLDTQSLMKLSVTGRQAHSLFGRAAEIKKYVERGQFSKLLTDKPEDFHLNDLVVAVHAALRLDDIYLCKIIVDLRNDVLQHIKFPEQFYDKTNTYHFGVLVKAISADENVEAELEKFRTWLDNKIKEKSFPYQAMRDAYKMSDKMHDQWTPYYRETFDVKVIGYFQRSSPAWLLRLLALGFMCEGNKEPFTLRAGESVDPSQFVQNQGLGFHFCINIYGERARTEGVRSSLVFHWEKVNNTREFIDDLLNASTKTLQELKELSEPAPTTQNPKRARFG